MAAMARDPSALGSSCAALLIPDDVAPIIFKHLTKTELAFALMTCKTWANFAKNNALWRLHYSKEWKWSGPELEDDEILRPLFQASEYYSLFQHRKTIDLKATQLIDELQWPSTEGTHAFMQLQQFGYLNIRDQLQRLASNKDATRYGLCYWAQQADRELRARYYAGKIKDLVDMGAPAEDVALSLSTALQTSDNSWVPGMLEVLAAECSRRIAETQSIGLQALEKISEVLFAPMWLDIHLNYQEHGYAVAPNHGFGIHLRPNSADFFDPRNSFLDCVLERRVGIPITLCLVYKSICDRIGLPVCMLNLPGQVMLHYGEHESDQERWIDGFSKGRMMTRDVVSSMFMEREGIDILVDGYMRPMTSRDIAIRMLNNLILSYQRGIPQLGRDENLKIVLRLLLSLDHPEAVEETLPPENYIPMYGQDQVSMLNLATLGGTLALDAASVRATLAKCEEKFSLLSTHWMAPRPAIPEGQAPPLYMPGTVVNVKVTAPAGDLKGPATVLMVGYPGWSKPSFLAVGSGVVEDPTARGTRRPLYPVYTTSDEQREVSYAILLNINGTYLELSVAASDILGTVPWSVEAEGHVHPDCGRYFESFSESLGMYLPNKWLRLIAKPLYESKKDE